MPLESLLGPALSLGFGALGGDDAREAQRRSEFLYQSALGGQRERAGQYQRGYRAALPYQNRMLEAAEGLEDDLLAAIDPITSAQMRRIRQEQQLVQSQLTQGFAARGMDSFTTRAGAQASAQGQAMNARSELLARMAARRQSAMMQGRSTYMNALSQRSGFETAYRDRQADVWDRISQINANTQIQPPNTAQNVGQLGAYITNLALGGFGGSGTPPFFG